MGCIYCRADIKRKYIVRSIIMGDYYDPNSAEHNVNQGFIGWMFGGGKKKKGDITDQGMSWMVAIFLFLFIFGPILFAKFVGWLWGKLLNLGTPGRIITTFLMLIVGPFILGFPLMMISQAFGSASLGSFGRAIITILAAVFMTASAVIPAAWYYIWHYDAVKLMGASIFSSIIKNFAMFFWFGFIGTGLISMASQGVGGFLAIAVSAAGFIYYYKATSEYRQEAKANPSKEISDKAKRTVALIVAGLLIFSAAVTTVSVIVSGIKDKVTASQTGGAAGE
jgi:MFS family permease